MKKQAQTILRLLLCLFFVFGLSACADGSLKKAPTTQTLTAQEQAATRYEQVRNKIPFLPMQRWAGGVTDFHSFHPTNWTAALGNLGNTVSRDIMAGNNMAMGSVFWDWTSSLVVKTATTDAFDNMRLKMDLVAGNVAGGVASGSEGTGKDYAPSLVVILAVTNVVFALFKMSRGQGQGIGKTLFIKMLCIALLFAMATGAAKSDIAAKKFGTFSPGWLVHQVDVTVGVFGKTASTLAVGVGDAVDQQTNPTNRNQFDCDHFKKTLVDTYKESLSESGDYVTPLILNGIWEDTALGSWRTSQFGNTKQAEDFDNYVYCHLLEDLSRIPMGNYTDSAATLPYGPGADWNLRASRMGVMVKSVQSFKAKTGRDLPLGGEGSPGWMATQMGDPNHKAQDRNFHIFGWIACEGASMRPGLPAAAPHQDGHEISDTSCHEWWYAKTDRELANGTGASVSASAFNFGGSISDFEKATSGDSTEFKDFVGTVRGINGGGSAIMASSAYVFSSISIAVAFTIVSALVLFGKLAVTLMIVILVGLTIVGAAPGTDVTTLAAQYAKKLIGFCIMSSGAGLLLSILSLVTDLLVTLGSAIFTGIAFMIFSGASSLLALITLHMLFTKVFKVASPFTPDGMQQWMKNAGSMGSQVAKAGGPDGSLQKAKDKAKSVKDRRGGKPGGPGGANGGAGKGADNTHGMVASGASMGGGAAPSFDGGSAVGDDDISEGMGGTDVADNSWANPTDEPLSVDEEGNEISAPDGEEPEELSQDYLDDPTAFNEDGTPIQSDMDSIIDQFIGDHKTNSQRAQAAAEFGVSAQELEGMTTQDYEDLGFYGETLTTEEATARWTENHHQGRDFSQAQNHEMIENHRNQVAEYEQGKTRWLEGKEQKRQDQVTDQVRLYGEGSVGAVRARANGAYDKHMADANRAASENYRKAVAGGMSETEARTKFDEDMKRAQARGQRVRKNERKAAYAQAGGRHKAAFNTVKNEGRARASLIGKPIADGAKGAFNKAKEYKDNPAALKHDVKGAARSANAARKDYVEKHGGAKNMVKAGAKGVGRGAAKAGSAAWKHKKTIGKAAIVTAAVAVPGVGLMAAPAFYKYSKGKAAREFRGATGRGNGDSRVERYREKRDARRADPTYQQQQRQKAADRNTRAQGRQEKLNEARRQTAARPKPAPKPKPQPAGAQHAAPKPKPQPKPRPQPAQHAAPKPAPVQPVRRAPVPRPAPTPIPTPPVSRTAPPPPKPQPAYVHRANTPPVSHVTDTSRGTGLTPDLW